MRPVFRFMILLGILAFSSSHARADSDAPLLLLYNERPPFMETKPDGTAAGLFVTPVFGALAKAHIDVSVSLIPVARQIAMIQANQTAVCALGKYKTLEREEFAKFSQPIYQDRAVIGLAGRNFQSPANASLDDLLADPNLHVLTKQAVIYGAHLDGKLAVMKAQRVDVASEYSVLFRMIQSGRAELAFFPIEELTYRTTELGLPLADFRVLRFPELEPGEKRYMMCSKLVTDELLKRFNAALPALHTHN